MHIVRSVPFAPYGAWDFDEHTFFFKSRIWVIERLRKYFCLFFTVFLQSCGLSFVGRKERASWPHGQPARSSTKRIYFLCKMIKIHLEMKCVHFSGLTVSKLRTSCSCGKCARSTFCSSLLRLLYCLMFFERWYYIIRIICRHSRPNRVLRQQHTLVYSFVLNTPAQWFSFIWNWNSKADILWISGIRFFCMKYDIITHSAQP